ncbi:hypothetical protein IJ596_05845 [bacterium]|nr:hypothetical protein [bacterium]
MLNNKLIPLVLALFAFSMPVCASDLTLDDLVVPRDAAYRVGISEIPENQYIEAEQERVSTAKNIVKEVSSENTDTTYADLSIKRLSREVSQDLEYEEQDMVADLSLLWQGAAMQSDTINFALYKLANPDADKPEKGTVKKMLQTIASMSTIVGASMANPLLAGTSLIGGNVLGIMSQDTKALNYKYTKVTDADMIILIRKVEDLQQNAVNLYYDYMTAKNQLDMITKLVQERRDRFETAQRNNAPKELIVITDAYYRTALDKQRSAKSEFFSKRAALEQFVGNEVFTQFESELALRESTRNGEVTANNVKEEYSKTVQDVENYTDNLSNGANQSQNNDYNTFIYDDTNLDKVPDLEPINVSQDISDNTVDEKVNNSDKKALNKLRKEDKARERTEKENSKYSTKGLIFSHTKADKSAEEQKEVSNSIQTKEVNTTSSKKTEKIDGVELLPLDDIRVPELKKDGYSIYSYYEN